MSPKLKTHTYTQPVNNYSESFGFFYNLTFPAKSWQDLTSIDIQWSPPIECQSWQDPAMIWQEMSNYRKTRLKNLYLLLQTQCTSFLFFTTPESTSMPPPTTKIRLRRVTPDILVINFTENSLSDELRGKQQNNGKWHLILIAGLSCVVSWLYFW